MCNLVVVFAEQVAMLQEQIVALVLCGHFVVLVQYLSYYEQTMKGKM